jgi:hypothetical protein
VVPHFGAPTIKKFGKGMAAKDSDTIGGRTMPHSVAVDKRPYTAVSSFAVEDEYCSIRE